MLGRKDSGNVGRITRGLKKSAIVDENEVQRRQHVKDVRSIVPLPAATKEVVPFKRASNNSTRGLVERSLNVTTRSMGLLTKPESSKEIVKEAKIAPKLTKTTLRFGGGNMLVSVDCAEDIDVYMRHLEDKCLLSPNFLSEIAENGGVDGRMRQILVDWLIHVQRRFSLLNETLSLAVFILDRALLQMEGQINKQNLQLLGVSCLFVAAKFEEIIVPNIQDFVYVAADVFTKKDVLRMEQKVLKAIDFQCSISHSIQFLRRYRFYLAAPKQVHNLAKFISKFQLFSDVGLVIYSLAHYKPSTLAAVSFYLAALVHKFPVPASVYKSVMQVDEKQISVIARKFVSSVLQLADSNAKLYALREKYHKEIALPFTSDQVQRMHEFANSDAK